MASETAVGFVRYADHLEDYVADMGVDIIKQAVADSAAYWNDQLNDLLRLFVTFTTKKEFKYRLPGGNSLQPLTKDGLARPRTYSGSYKVGLPMRWGADAIGFDRESRVKMKVQAVNDWTVEAMKADNVWNRKFILKALLDNRSWTYEDENTPESDDPDITVYPLANGDSVEYLLRNGNRESAHSHYLAYDEDTIGDGVGEINPFNTIYRHLYEHPSNNLDQLGFAVTYVAENLEDGIGSLANLKELKSAAIIPGITEDRLNESVMQHIAFGDEVLGFIDRNVIVRWSALPDGYMVSHAPGGGAVLAAREEENPALRGLLTEHSLINGNHDRISILRKRGYGVLNRVGAVVTQINSAVDNTYEIPSGYDAYKDIG